MADHTNPDDEYYIEGWFYGTMEDEDAQEYLDYDGDIQLSKKDDIIIGSIRPFNSDRLYRVMSIETGKHILMRYNANYIASHGACSPLDPPNTPAQKINTPCEKEIRVLVLYTKRVKDRIADYIIPNIARAQIQYLNGAVYNTTYGNTQGLNFKLVATEYLSDAYFTETQNGDLLDIRNNVQSLQGSSQVAFRKSFHQADLVVCLTAADYQNHYGIAVDIGVASSISTAIVEYNAPINKYILGHEVGHLMGARHQQSWITNTATLFSYGEPDDNGTYEHGFKIQKGSGLWKKYYVDIMHEKSFGNTDHVLSSPSLVWRGKRYGKINENDVIRQFQEYGCTVADFVNGPAPFFTATATGPLIASTNQSVSVVGTPFYGYPPYEYKWYLSTDGGSSYSLISQQTSVSYNGNVTFNMPNSPKALVYMFVTDNVNQAKGVYRTVHNVNISLNDFPDVEHCCPVFDTDAPKPAGVTNVNEDAQSAITIMPNPANDYATIQTSIPVKDFSGAFKISVADVTGKILESRNIYTASDVWQFNTSNLSSGVYLITLEGSSLHLTEKLLINK